MGHFQVYAPSTQYGVIGHSNSIGWQYNMKQFSKSLLVNVSACMCLGINLICFLHAMLICYKDKCFTVCPYFIISQMLLNKSYILKLVDIFLFRHSYTLQIILITVLISHATTSISDNDLAYYCWTLCINYVLAYHAR